MHDYFHILGVPTDANPDVIRRACERRARRWHPDLSAGATPDVAARQASADSAIDFVDMSAIVDRMHASFFRSAR